MLPRQTKRLAILCVSLLGIIYLFLYTTRGRNTLCFNNIGDMPSISRKTSVVDSSGKLFEYDRRSPIIFIGGVPRSGTTLMRAMIDAHQDVRCGEETRVVPRILQMRAHWMRSTKESIRLEEAGLTGDVIDSAISSFILEVVAKHGEPAPRLCNKDPFTLKGGSYLKRLFPKSKFLFMVRDGRATVHSIITRKVTITGFDLKSYRQCLKKWNTVITAMDTECNSMGPDNCMRVPYEQLVLHPKAMMTKILSFLDLPWSDSVLHHEEQINKPNGISLSKVERSSDQVVKPVNLDALSKWVGHIPEDVIADMPEIAPMLTKFGYDPIKNPPNYGKPDNEVVKNTNDILQHNKEWEKRGDEVKSLSKKGT